MRLHIVLLLATLLFSCANKSEVQTDYRDQIGDTVFNSNLDDPQFRFCDASKVLHKRAYISYVGGKKALEDAIMNAYEFNPEHHDFSGYIIVRFAVNCEDKAGRFRMQTLDPDFNLTTCPESLSRHILTIFKNLKDWKHAIYKGESYDGYTFHTVKIDNGKIQKT